MENQADPDALADEAGGADPKVDTSVRKSSKGKSEQNKSEQGKSEAARTGQSKSQDGQSAQAKDRSGTKNGPGQDSMSAGASDSSRNGGQSKSQNGTPDESAVPNESKPSVFTKQSEKRSDASVPKGLSRSESSRDSEPGSGSEGNRKPSPPPPSPSRSVFTPASVTKPHRFPETEGPVNPDSPFKSVTSQKADSPSPQGGDAGPRPAATPTRDAAPAKDTPPVGSGGRPQEDDQSETTSTRAAAALARELTSAGFASPGFRSTR
ncbi:MAG: hypothetical protein LBV34_18360, partial [Nocardiopsaceae bacterium]|nr:hypothetical protein [Nocardiopsaceae bacterium]